MADVVNTRTYWNNYNNVAKAKLAECITKSKPYEVNKTILLKKLTANNARLRYYFGYQVDDIKDGVTVKLSQPQIVKTFALVPKGTLSKSEIAFELEKLVLVNRKLLVININKKKFEDAIIEYDLYRYILKRFNLAIVDEIIKGYEFNAGYGIATIRIQKKERDLTRDVVNWNVTLRAKRKLIEEGKLPYKALERDKNKVITKDNGGIPYFVYMTDHYSYWWYWNKRVSSLPNQLVYNFTPVRGANCIIRKLHVYREKNPLVVHNYRE